jgi:hypothetical protein
MAWNKAGIRSEFHYLSAEQVGSNGNVTGRVQVNTYPALRDKGGRMKFDHLSCNKRPTALQNNQNQVPFPEYLLPIRYSES